MEWLKKETSFDEVVYGEMWRDTMEQWHSKKEWLKTMPFMLHKQRIGCYSIRHIKRVDIDLSLDKSNETVFDDGDDGKVVVKKEKVVEDTNKNGNAMKRNEQNMESIVQSMNIGNDTVSDAVDVMNLMESKGGNDGDANGIGEKQINEENDENDTDDVSDGDGGKGGGRESKKERESEESKTGEVAE